MQSFENETALVMSARLADECELQTSATPSKMSDTFEGPVSAVQIVGRAYVAVQTINMLTKVLQIAFKESPALG